MHTPYLIQRGNIIKPMVNGKISNMVDFDYMGSSEFEFGALGKSLRAFQSNQQILKLVTDTRIQNDEKSVRILHSFSPEDFEQYFDYMLKMRENKLRLKEAARFQESDKSFDFWWDIQNHVMWSFHKMFMNRIKNTLNESWKYMDANNVKLT